MRRLVAAVVGCSPGAVGYTGLDICRRHSILSTTFRMFILYRCGPRLVGVGFAGGGLGLR